MTDWRILNKGLYIEYLVLGESKYTILKRRGSVYLEVGVY